ncbi:MAG: hypothetical protein LBJ23_08085 [Tannerella sp.]|nr:hypothetical protein [Tannerella sp.]
MKKFPFRKQPDAMECGATCLRMIAAYYGREYSAEGPPFIFNTEFTEHTKKIYFTRSETASLTMNLPRPCSSFIVIERLFSLCAPCTPCLNKRKNKHDSPKQICRHVF